MEMTERYEYIIVGSGTGGATLARELCRKGKRVLLLEAGASGFPPPFTIETSIEGTDVFTAYGAGGAGALMNGNGVRCLQKELGRLGIELEEEFRELETELKLAPIHESLLSSDGSIRILERCGKAGIAMERMPKFIDHTRCARCGNCSLGCPTGAKWTPLEFLKEAQSQGLEIIFNARAETVIVEQGRARGVRCGTPEGAAEYFGDAVVIAAGGLKSPVILRNSGIEQAGGKLFIDLCELWYGITPDIDISTEPPMQLVDTEFLEEEGFILSTGYIKNREKLRYYLKERADEYIRYGHVTVIVKIRDDAVGRVNSDGTFSKTATAADRVRLDKGGAAARDFLLAIGARPDSILKRQGLYGGHNGASCAIGSVVDNRLRTEVKNLYVCDGSVLPVSPGLPPVLTIMAVARWFAKRLE
jgi:choline dehydrogenase-like flavoprotein